MHPLQNGSQDTNRPPRKPFSGQPGWFTESGDNNAPSYPGADWFNHVIAEFQNMLSDQGIAFDPEEDDHLRSGTDSRYRRTRTAVDCRFARAHYRGHRHRRTDPRHRSFYFTKLKPLI